jgi:hypothetical protein
MIHDAAGIVGSMIHDAGWAEAAPLMNRPTDRATCGFLNGCGDRWAMIAAWCHDDRTITR